MSRFAAVVIALVAVGAVGLTFAAHVQTQSNPQLMDRLFRWLDSFSSEKTYYRSLDTLPPLAAMHSAEDLLVELCKKQSRTSKRNSGELNRRIKQLVDMISKRWEELQNTGNIAEDDQREARMIALRAQFLGAKTWPAQFKEPFLANARTIIKNGAGTQDAVRADTLRFLCQHALDKPIGPQFFRDIDQFTRKYAQSTMVLSLYATAATELMKNGQKDSARALLKHGLEVYENSPHVWKLINVLVGQGLAPPPPSQITKTSWEAYVQSIGGPERHGR